MIWNPFSLIIGFYARAQKREALASAKRWRKAVAQDPELRADLIRLGGVMTLLPRALRDGVPELEPIDPLRQAYDAGRREFALHLLALSGLTIHDLNILSETDDE